MKSTGLWASLLNKRAEKDSEKVLETLQVKTGDIIADIGSGGGYFTFKLAKLTGFNGRVYAVDTDTALLDRIIKTAQKDHLLNIETVISKEDDASLPKESCDFIFMRNVFHHIENPSVYFQKLKESIKPGGRIAILDWTGKGHAHMGHSDHATPEADIQTLLTDIGFTHLESYDFLDGQSFNIFQK